MHVALWTAFQIQVGKPVNVVHLWKILAIMIKSPAAFGAIKRRPRSHLRAITDEAALHRPHQVVRVLHPELLDLVVRSKEIIETSLQSVGVFWGLQIVVYMTPQLVFKQVRLDPFRARERTQHAFAFCIELAVVDPGCSSQQR